MSNTSNKKKKKASASFSTEVVTSEGEHWYPTGIESDPYYPSVTTILSNFPKGVGFAKYLAGQSSWESSQAILKTAGERGTKVHKATESLERGETLDRAFFNLDEWEMLMGFVEWHHTYNPQLIHMERRVLSHKYRTAGTVDRIYLINGLVEVLDIKTSSAIYDSYWLQVGAYAQMYADESTNVTRVDRTSILRLTGRRKTGYEYAVESDWRDHFKIFQAHHQVWDHLNKSTGPKTITVPAILKL